MRRFSILLLLTTTIGLPAATPAGAAEAAADLDLAFGTDDLTTAALLPEGARLRLRAVPLEPARDLELRRIRVFSPDARLTVQTADGERRQPVPDHAYFGGGIAGEPGSRAFLSVLASGEIRGLIAGGGRWWLLGERPGEAAVRVAEADPAAVAARSGSFRCEADQLDASALLEMAGGQASAGPRSLPAGTPADGTLPSFTARIAFETDQEFLALFGGSTSAAIAYVGDLIAYGSTIYEDEIDTNLVVSSINLWQSPDPWSQSNACRLFEFGRYWNDNNTGIDRTIAHFLSGQSANVGIAWLGVLCSGGFLTDISGNGCTLAPTVDNYGGDYGYTGGIDADFDPGNPQVIWDLVATIHEIGHNFSSPHTHCYAGLGGNPNPVDQCFNGQCGQSGCWCGAQSLPCGNPPGPGGGCGTIMSYCHLLGGGLGNISPTFGLGHPFGVATDRVPARMSAHVVSRAAANPGCLDFTLPTLVFVDGFESGNTSAWSEVVGG